MSSLIVIFNDIDNVFINRPIMARSQILVHRWGPAEQGSQRCFADGLNQSLVSSVAQGARIVAVTVIYAIRTFI